MHDGTAQPYGMCVIVSVLYCHPSHSHDIMYVVQTAVDQNFSR